jgi:hypothetical protein
MALPGKYKKKINLTRDRQNTEYTENFRMESAAAENMKDMIIDKDAYLPKGVMHIDLDAGFKEFVTDTMALTLNGERVPVFMMGIQKWTEFSKTWKFSDEYKNVKIPFVNIVRQPDTKPGSNPALIYNVPQGKNYTYAEVPTWDGNRKGVDVYTIPQPVPIDISYDVRIFAYRQQDLNKFNTTILKNFQSRQAYTIVNGHYIPIILEDTSDESKITDLDNKRFYVQVYSFMLQGFILDPEDFEVTPGINRTFTMVEGGGAVAKTKTSTIIGYISPTLELVVLSFISGGPILKGMSLSGIAYDDMGKALTIDSGAKISRLAGLGVTGFETGTYEITGQSKAVGSANHPITIKLKR